MQYVQPWQHPSTATASTSTSTRMNLPQQQPSLETTSLLSTNENMNLCNTTSHNTNNNNINKKKFKFIVLGAANAGKTSILRQYFYHQFDNDNDNNTSSNSNHNKNNNTSTSRIATVGSDYYVGRIPIQIPIENNDNNNSKSTSSSSPTTTSSLQQQQQQSSPSTTIYMNVQMWDTPGKENFTMQQQQQRKYNYNNNHYNTSNIQLLQHFNEKFIYNADGIMLVYDMTSSTSFTRLLKWYSTIIDLLHIYNNNNTNTPKKSIPIVIVANKFDLYNQWYDNNNNNRSDSNSHPTKNNSNNKMNPTSKEQQQQQEQRDVLGLHGIDYYGKNFQYEYQITIQNNNNNNNNYNHNNSSFTKLSSRKNSHCSSNNNNDITTSDPYTTTNTSTNTTTKRRMEISSYLVNHDNWIQDMSYLESLIQSENESHPDHDMVLLWCQKNSLQLITVSAKTGNGIHDAITTLIHLAIQNNYNNNDRMNQEDVQQKQQHSYTSTETSINAIQSNETSYSSILLPPSTQPSASAYTKRISSSNSNKLRSNSTSRQQYQYNPELDLHGRFTTNNKRRSYCYHCFWNWNCDWLIHIISNLFQNCIR